MWVLSAVFSKKNFHPKILKAKFVKKPTHCTNPSPPRGPKNKECVEGAALNCAVIVNVFRGVEFTGVEFSATKAREKVVLVETLFLAANLLPRNTGIFLFLVHQILEKFATFTIF